MSKPVGQRVKEIHPDDLLIQFSPEMMRGFARLEAMVNNSEHVEPETLLTLQELAGGRHFILKESLFWISKIVQETSEHSHATGDERAKEALSNLMTTMWDIEKEPGYTPFTLAKRSRTVHAR
jgi:hypothetical protein